MDYTGEEKKRGSPCGANTSIIGTLEEVDSHTERDIAYQLVTIKVGFYVSLSFARISLCDFRFSEHYGYYLKKKGNENIANQSMET